MSLKVPSVALKNEDRERAKIASGNVSRVKRHFLPYGIWKCEGGREVLYDRRYRALLERSNGGPAILADGDEWIENIKEQSWFYKDGTPEQDKRKAAIAMLKEWGIKP